ncbi:MAG TPA: hypothetical protein VK648_00225 [Gemmatimonadaceae bacterium]|nr:hypothetical protein [Gemmatimonadaceae bacterium]
MDGCNSDMKSIYVSLGRDSGTTEKLFCESDGSISYIEQSRFSQKI